MGGEPAASRGPLGRSGCVTREEKRRLRQEQRHKVRELQEIAKGPIDIPFLILVLMLVVTLSDVGKLFGL